MKKLDWKFWKRKTSEQKNTETTSIYIENKINEFLKVEQMDNILKITVLKECDIEEFYQEACGKIDKEKVDILTLRILLKNMKIPKKELYLIETEQGIYNIAMDYLDLKISERLNLKDQVEEKILELNPYDYDYSFCILLHNEMGSTISTKTYSSNREKNSDLFIGTPLDKKDAIKELRKLLENLTSIQNIGEIIDMHQLYRSLKQVPEEDYNPVISNGTISLSREFFAFHERSIENQISGTFDILLEDSKEVIGNIGFCYYREGFHYSGNIYYSVDQHFRNHHYATEALRLLKDLLKNNQFQGDRDFYIATEIDNLYSSKVAINNGGVLVYQGEVPDGELIKDLDGIKEVKVYKIEMNEKI